MSVSAEQDWTSVAQATLDKLRRDGWSHRGAYGPDSRSVCVIMAIPFGNLGFLAALQAKVPNGQVVPWNEAPGRTEEEVHNLLKSFGAK